MALCGQARASVYRIAELTFGRCVARRVYRIPDVAKVKARMLYSSSQNAIAESLNAPIKVQGSALDEVSYEEGESHPFYISSLPTHK